MIFDNISGTVVHLDRI